MISGRWFLLGRVQLCDYTLKTMRQNVRKTGLRVGATLIWPPASQEWRGLAGCHAARPSHETPISVTGGDPRIRIRMNPDLADQNTELKRWIQEDARNPRPIWVAWVKSKDPRDRFCFLGRTPGCVMLGRF